MLRINVQTNAEAVKRYFRESFTRSDYYTGDEIVVGRWAGRDAGRLDLWGEVTQAAFERLVDNQHPATGNQLTPRSRADRRVGYDLNFSCPKSVSVLYAVGGDARILEAFQESVRDAMAIMEAHATTRVRSNGQDTDRLTSTLVWSEFIHGTTRPVNGVPDPHLHSHCYVFNATFDREESRWKAVQSEPFFRLATYVEACFLSGLAARLYGLGYTVEPKGRFWEVSGCPQSLIDKFSNRTREINAKAEREGIVDPKEKAKLGAKTRRGKGGALKGDALKREWAQRLTREEAAWTRNRGGNGPSQRSSPEVDRAVRFSLSKLFERSSVLGEDVVVEDVLRSFPGEFPPDAVREALKVNGVVRREIDGRTLLSTESVLRDEQAMVRLAAEGRGKHRSFGGHFTKERGLTADQTVAGARVLASRDFVTMLAGKAGTGKTTLIKAVIERMREAGHKDPVMLAPTSRASRLVMREEGHSKANTLAKFFADEDMQKAAKGGVIWVDEAGLLGTKDALRLLTLAKELGARVVLSGDPWQHRAVARGMPMRTLEEYAGIQPVRLESNQRQRGPLREVVEHLGAWRTREGIEKLRAMGSVRETDDVYKSAAAAYADEVASRPGTKRGRRVPAFLIVPTHNEIKQTTDEVRAQLKERKLLGKEREFTVLTPVDGTLAERSLPSFYQPGMVVQFSQNASKGYKAGSRWKVMGTDIAGNVITRNGVKIEALPLAQADRFQVYRESKIAIAVGEKIRITRNGRTKSVAETAVDNAFGGPQRGPNRDLLNSSVHGVKRFTRNGGLHLDNGLYVDKDFGHFTYGYASTSQAAQGITCDHAICVATERSGRAVNPRHLYVAVSRGRERVSLFTDSVETLKAAELKRDDERSALNLDPAIKVMKTPSRPSVDREYDANRKRRRGRNDPEMEK